MSFFAIKIIISIHFSSLKKLSLCDFFLCRGTSIALFIYPVKSNFFVRLQIFLYAGCNFLPPEELTPNAKNYDCGYWCLQIWSRNLHNGYFLEIFVQIPKNNSSQSCIICNFAAWKNYLQPAHIKLHLLIFWFPLGFNCAKFQQDWKTLILDIL